MRYQAAPRPDINCKLLDCSHFSGSLPIRKVGFLAGQPRFDDQEPWRVKLAYAHLFRVLGVKR
jgi:hypothetical protein